MLFFISIELVACVYTFLAVSVKMKPTKKSMMVVVGGGGGGGDGGGRRWWWVSHMGLSPTLNIITSKKNNFNFHF